MEFLKDDFETMSRLEIAFFLTLTRRVSRNRDTRDPYP